MIVPQIFGVTLQRVDKAFVGCPLHRFDQAISGDGGHSQRLGHATHRLVVEGVDR